MSHRKPKFSGAGDADPDAIEATAAEWLVRRDRGLVTGERAELARWLRADQRHAAVFQALEATWHLIGEAAPVSAAAANPGRRYGRERRWWPVPLAAAAALAVASLAWWRIAGESGRAAVAPFALNATTEVGRLRTVELPDGSVVQLNSDSAVEVRFESAVRRVALSRGEAHFTVARNPGRPFIVSAAGVDVRVVGTVFNVRLRSEAVDVLVTEGKVRVGSVAQPVMGAISSPAEAPLSELTAGQHVSVALPARGAPVVAAPVDVPSTEIQRTLAWRTRRLDFDAVPLADIVAEINRHNRHQLSIVDARLNGQRFGGSFPAGEYETFVRMLEANFGVVAERGVAETRLRLKSP